MFRAWAKDEASRKLVNILMWITEESAASQFVGNKQDTVVHTHTSTTGEAEAGETLEPKASLDT